LMNLRRRDNTFHYFGMPVRCRMMGGGGRVGYHGTSFLDRLVHRSSSSLSNSGEKDHKSPDAQILVLSVVNKLSGKNRFPYQSPRIF
jgi:hypothetical protein